MKVLISDKMSPLAEQKFKERGIEVDVKTGLSEDELCQIIRDYDGLVVRSSTKVTEKIIDHSSLKVIGRAGIGVDNIDIPAASKNGAVVMNTPFGNSTTTAEHTIAMMMAVCRQIPAANQSTQEGKWEKSRFMGIEVSHKTLGIIGCGNIGAIVAERAIGLKLKIVAYDPFLSEKRAKELGVTKTDLEGLLAAADIITLHTPLNDQTRGILNKETIAKAKKGVFIVNCARGGLVNEADLKEALDNGHVQGAALDVFEKEPAKENVLFGTENVVTTPHLGASTFEAQTNVAIQVAEQMSDYLLSGIINNAINAPAVSAEEAPQITPYLKLTEQLGSFSGQITETGLKTIEIEYLGQAANINTKPVTANILSNLLKPLLDSVNPVSAPIIAKQRNISIREVMSEEVDEFITLIRITIETETGKRSVAGTLYGEDKPRIVEINHIPLEAELSENMLYVKNIDKPGFIGHLGICLSKANINIGTFHLGRHAPGKEAVTLVAIDQVPSNGIIDEIEKFPHTIQVKALSF